MIKLQNIPFSNNAHLWIVKFWVIPSPKKIQNVSKNLSNFPKELLKMSVTLITTTASNHVNVNEPWKSPLCHRTSWNCNPQCVRVTLTVPSRRINKKSCLRGLSLTAINSIFFCNKRFRFGGNCRTLFFYFQLKKQKHQNDF